MEASARRRRFRRWANDDLRGIAERDLPMLGIPSSPQRTHRLLRMLAALNGQQWNASELGRSLGLNYRTVTRYVDFVEGALLIRRLPAYHANLSKRLVKAPKIHWRDTGLLHALIGIHSRDALLVHPSVGASWESYVVEQVLGALHAHGVIHTASHFRTSDGYEVDLVLEIGSERWAIEFKLTSSPSPRDFERLDHCAELIGATWSVLVSRVARDAGDKRRLSCGVPRLLKEVRSQS